MKEHTAEEWRIYEEVKAQYEKLTYENQQNIKCLIRYLLRTQASA